MFAGGTCRMRSTSLPRRPSIATRRCPSATPVSRVVARHAFVAPFVVAGQPGHELLGVASFDVVEEVRCRGAAQRCRMSTTVGDPHLSTAGCPFEAFGLPSTHRWHATRRCRWRSSAIGGLRRRRLFLPIDPLPAGGVRGPCRGPFRFGGPSPYRGRRIDLVAVERPIIGNDFLVTGCGTNVCSIEWVNGNRGSRPV